MNKEVLNDWRFESARVPKEIKEFINETFKIVEIRGKIAEIKGVKFLVHTNEKNHSIPHIHAEYGEYSISIRIDTGEVLSGNLPNKRQTFAVKWVLENQVELYGKWNSIAISATSRHTMSAIPFEE